MSSLIFYAEFTKAGVATTPASAPTVTVYSVARSTGAEASVVAGGTCTASGLAGRYFYQLAAADLQTYDYHARFSTTDTSVDQADAPALWTRWSEAVATDAAGAVTPADASLSATVLGAGFVSAIQTGLAKPSDIPADYQQRGVSVTLPDPAPAGYGGAISGTVDANLVSILGSAPAAQNLHDDEMAPAPTIPTATDNAAAVWGATARTLTAFNFLVTLADGSLSSAKLAVGTVNAAATGLLERLMLLVGRFFPAAGGSVTVPKAGGNLVVKGAGGAIISTQPATDDGTTQTLGPAS